MAKEEQVLKVLMIGWEFPPEISGGLGVACGAIAKELGAEVELTVLLPGQASHYQSGEYQLVGMGVLVETEVYQSDLDSTYGGDLWARTQVFRERAIDWARERECCFDVIYAHDWLSFSTALGLRAFINARFVAHIHSLQCDRVNTRCLDDIYWLERTVAHEADVVLTVSRYTESVLRDFYAVTHDRVRVVHNGIEPRSQGLQKRTTSLCVGFVGRLTSQKDPLMFVNMAAELRGLGCRFLILGSGDLENELRQEISRLGMESDIELLGFLPRELALRQMGEFDVLVLPSLSEPYGLVALEAAQLGCRLVLSPCCGAAEVLPQAQQVGEHTVEAYSSAVERAFEGGIDRSAIRSIPTWRQATERILGHLRK